MLILVKGDAVRIETKVSARRGQLWAGQFAKELIKLKKLG